MGKITFFTLVVLGVMVTSAFGVEPAGEAAAAKSDRVLRHVVLLKFKDSVPAEKVKQLEQAFYGLADKVDSILDLEGGRDVSVEGLADGFTHCFRVTFRDEKGRAAYLPHKAHQEFVDAIKPNLEKVLVVDYATALTDKAAQQQKNPQRVLRHVVLFKYKDTSDAEAVQGIMDAFAKLPGKCEVIHDFECGTDCSVEGLADGFQHCFYVTFKDADGRATYLPHPAHKQFVSLLKPHLEKPVVIDYWTSR
jgi:hypothetical protein